MVVTHHLHEEQTAEQGKRKQCSERRGPFEAPMELLKFKLEIL